MILARERTFINRVVELSVVIPCYNEGERFSLLRDEIQNSALAHLLEVEWLVVEDGSRSEHVAKVSAEISALQKQGIAIRHLIQTKNGGKGAALDIGFKAALGNWIAFVDADGATPIHCLEEMFSFVQKKPEWDAILGSRVKMLGKKVTRLWRRHLSGRIFVTFFNCLFKISVYDPQCGMKLYKRSAVLPLLGKIMDHRWVWDTQLLVLLYQGGFNIMEYPVDWHEVPGSKVSLFKDSLRMIYSLYQFKKRNGT